VFEVVGDAKLVPVPVCLLPVPGNVGFLFGFVDLLVVSDDDGEVIRSQVIVGLPLPFVGLSFVDGGDVRGA